MPRYRCATRKVAATGSREIAGPAHRVPADGRKYTQTAGRERHKSQSSTTCRDIKCSTSGGTGLASVFHGIRYRRAYHSLCFSGFIIAPRISDNTFTTITSDPTTITPAEIAA